jgi:hypothetical protein
MSGKNKQVNKNKNKAKKGHKRSVSITGMFYFALSYRQQ